MTGSCWIEPLTGQELRVAAAVAAGRSNKATARELFVSVKTIEFHLSNIYRKLGISSRMELARRFDRATSPGRARLDELVDELSRLLDERDGESGEPESTIVIRTSAHRSHRPAIRRVPGDIGMQRIREDA